VATQEVFIRQLSRSHSWRNGSGPAALSASAIHIWKISLEQAPDRVQAFHELLAAGERSKCERLRLRRDRDAFCICRGGLRLLLGRYAGLAPERVRLRPGRYGKPGLDPRLRPRDIELNVSHSGRWALIALAEGRQLGVDIQEIDAPVDSDLIARRFFSAQENEAIRAFAEGMKTAAFYACWTRKEAAVKALGESITRLSREVVVSADPRGPARILQLPAGGTGRGWHLHDLPVEQGYAAALCYRGPKAEIFLWQPDEWGSVLTTVKAARGRSRRTSGSTGDRHRLRS
jgi:4'-phosphopantetheinyl transferase